MHRAELPVVCILAGGLGSRLGVLVRDIPKPLVEVAGRPFVIHQLRTLAEQGVTRIVICVGHHGQKVVDTVGHQQFGMNIAYSFDAPGLSGTLGAIRRAQTLLGPRFLVLYGDTFLRVDLAAFFEGWNESGLLGGMTVLRNADQWDPSNALFRDQRIVAYDKRSPEPSMEWIDYGLGALDREALELVPANQTDLSDLYTRLAVVGELFGFEVTDRFYEIGTPKALAETDSYLRSIGYNR